MFTAKIRRGKDLEVYMQSAELADLMESIHNRNRKNQGYSEGPELVEFTNASVYQAKSTDGGETWERLKKLSMSARATNAALAPFNVYRQAYETIAKAVPNVTLRGTGLFEGGSNVNLWPLLCAELRTGLVIVNPDPMSVSQLRAYSERLYKVVEDILTLARPVDITVSFNKVPAPTPAPTVT